MTEFEAISARILPPLTELAARATADSQHEESAVARFSELIAQQEVPLPPTMGVRDYLLRILRLVGARQKVRELDPQEKSLTWLAVHVPANCSATIATEGSDLGQRELELCAFGSGLGSQLVVTLTTKMKSGPRTTCANYELAFHVQPIEYLVDGRTSAELSIASFDGERSVERVPCTACNADWGRDRLNRFSAEPFIDLVRDSAPATVAREYDVSSAQTGSLGIDVPGIGTRLTVKARAAQKQIDTLVHAATWSPLHPLCGD